MSDMDTEKRRTNAALLEAYLAKQDKIIAGDREKTLIALGLTVKEYAPGNTPTYQYKEYEYQGGEKVYYRRVAMPMTDEEYRLVLEKARQVEEIESRQRAEEERRRAPGRIVKHLRPEFALPRPQPLPGETEEKSAEGRSKIARALRVLAWTGFIGLLIACFVLWVVSISPDAEVGVDFSTVCWLLGGAVLELLLFCALAEILDALAELTAIARHGYKYSEGPK